MKRLAHWAAGPSISNEQPWNMGTLLIRRAVRVKVRTMEPFDQRDSAYLE